MSKLSRTVLKEIVKECIIEIFEESFFAQGDMIYESKKSYSKDSSSDRKKPRRSSKPRMKENKRHHLDNIKYNNNHNDNRFNAKIDNITSNLTNDPVMADIFKDTASTTLQQQISAGSSKGMSPINGDAASLKAHNSDPTELFAESSNKWATLAFAESIKR